MTGFIAHIPPADVPAEVIDNEPFFPAIATTDLRAIGRFDGGTTPEQLRAAILAALTHVNDQLRDWAAQQQGAGHTTLADVPAPQIASQSVRLHAYRRAIAHAAMGQLEDTRRAQSTLPAGMGKDARVLESVGLRTADHWRDMRNAIADVMQRMRETVELI
ncbi:head completion/stabilization protein [Ottowia sp.]|uniref:head completion/stabilization protein n=1 Tax=Ottowia sp. TaxID=1898956 RepID=UPI003A859A3E